MANSLQSKKRARQAKSRRLHNVGLRSMMRTQIKKTLAAIQKGEYESAQSAYKVMTSILDSFANKHRGILSKRKAARHKQRFNKQLKALKVGQA